MLKSCQKEDEIEKKSKLVTYQLEDIQQNYEIYRLHRIDCSILERQTFLSNALYRSKRHSIHIKCCSC